GARTGGRRCQAGRGRPRSGTCVHSKVPAVNTENRMSPGVPVMARVFAAAALALALSPLGAAAQEYAVKIKQPGLGDKSQVKAQGSSDVQFKVVDDAGNAVMEAKESKTKKFSFSEVGLERAQSGDQLVRIKRRY